VDINTVKEGDPLLNEHAATVRDDEEEVFDLGFIVDNRDDRRDSLLASWQRLDDLDTDEALETDPAGRLPDEAEALEQEGVPELEYPTDIRLATAEAEGDEEEFAGDNCLMDDPYAPPVPDGMGVDDQTSEEDLDGNENPEIVSIRGRARGVVRGLGTSVPQDIGAGGFSVQPNRMNAPRPEEPRPLGSLVAPARPGERAYKRRRSRPNGRDTPR
jgi:hypothetical protein